MEKIKIRDEYASGTYQIRIGNEEFCYIHNRELTYMLPILLKELGHNVEYIRVEE